MAKQRGRYPHISDEQLVLNALLGDFEAFDELVSRYRNAVIVVATQALGSREAAEDLAQESFLLAFKALPQLQEPARFGGWICSIARHRAWRVSRQEARQEPTEDSKLDTLILRHSPTLASCPEETLLRRSAQAEIHEHLSELPSEFQVVLQLRYFEEWPVAHIADFLSLPLTTVKWRLHRGRDLLRRRLTAEEEKNHGTPGIESTGDTPNSPPAARDRPTGRTCQPDRQPGQRQPNRYPPVQPYP
ncbi:MAG: polymerase sigma factor SigW-like protein [Chthonomonadaceae bacterium]|nr:polymerase sigma factor SigW-like protein [Chthonomonadaceae bacterium]